MPIRTIVVLISLLIPLLAEGQKKAVFIIVDGISADVLEKLKTPAISGIAAAGGYTRAHVGGEKGTYCESPTISAPGYNHVLTGTWSNKHNVVDNDIAQPVYHYWNIFRIAKHAKPGIRTAIFSTWTDNRTKLIGEGKAEAGNFKFDFAADGYELDEKSFPHTEDRVFILKIDEHVTDIAASHIRTHAPDLSWVYLEYTDDIGHMHGDGPEYEEAIRKADNQIARIWDAVQERQRVANEEWMIVVTTDHGRDALTGRDHGGQSERERTTWIATNASNLNPHFSEMPSATDILPSILRFMNIPVASAIGDELDGISFIGRISASKLRATRTSAGIELAWNVVDPSGEAEVRVTRTNNFRNGGQDVYETIGKVPVRNGRFIIPTAVTGNGFLKVVVRMPFNTLNVWVE